MEPGYMYYGQRVDPNRKSILTDVPVSQDQKNDADLVAFKQTYPRLVREAVQKSMASLRDGVYDKLPSQEGAFAHLEELFINTRIKIVEIVSSSAKNDEVLFQVKVAVPVDPEKFQKAFTKPISEGAACTAFVSFYCGLTPCMATLVKKNVLIEKALAEMQEKTEVDSETQALFDPEKVVGYLLNALRAERRYRYLSTFTAEVVKDSYYKTPEGFIYRVEVNGYAAAVEVAPPKEAPQEQ